jgi:hypothetical protein
MDGNALLFEHLFDLLLKFETAVVRTEGDFHEHSLIPATIVA